MKKFLLLSVFFFIFFSCDSNRVEPGFSKRAVESVKEDRPERKVPVETRTILLTHEAVGTIRPLTESVIESQTSATVRQVLCVPGAAVKKGEILVKLDDRRLKTRLNQAEEGVSIARKQLTQSEKSVDESKAGLDQAQSDFNRTKKLFDSGIVSSQQLERDQSAYRQSRARLEKSGQVKQAAMAAVRRAEEVVKEARISLGFADITSPADGVVARRMIDPGDLAVPGKPLLIIQTSGALRLEANVREGLIHRISKGETYRVKIETLNKTFPSVIEEILPYADPDTRTFLVKASLPMTDGIYPGMFGRLIIPVQPEQTFLIPRQAITRVGQLEMVKVKDKDQWRLVYIKTGKIFDEKIEILSGLSGNDTIGY